MSELAVYSCIMVSGVLISSFSQIMLKKSAQKTFASKIKEYLNPTVIIAYLLFFFSSFLSLIALKVIPLSMSPILEASGYIFIAILSYIFLKEKLTRKQLLGMALIIGGIAVYTLEL